jgi:hypothetical protein
METTMLYKTIILRMLQQRPQMHEQLRKERQLLSTVNRYARELKANHEAWKERLAQAKPGTDSRQTASEAAEMALAEMEDRLPTESPPNDQLSLDAAMAFLRRHTPND